MEAQFAASTNVDVVEQYPGTGSTDFWGISFAFSSIDGREMSSKELERELGLMQACWTFFDDVRSRASAEMQKGPRGGGRDRERIVHHTLGTEQAWAGKLGVHTPPGEVVTRRQGAEGVPRRLLRGHPDVPFRGQDGANVAAAVPDPAQRLSHDGSRLGDGRQRPDRRGRVARHRRSVQSPPRRVRPDAAGRPSGRLTSPRCPAVGDFSRHTHVAGRSG
jgi:hypothetical protein